MVMALFHVKHSVVVSRSGQAGPAAAAAQSTDYSSNMKATCHTAAASQSWREQGPNCPLLVLSL